MKKILVVKIFLLSALFADNTLVKITPDTPSVTINDHGVEVTIKRIQDTAHRLTDDFAKTSRECPPHCIRPIEPIKGVQTVGEIELIDFIKNKVYKKKGLLIDSRIKSLYEIETIPGAINIPFTLLETNSQKIIDRLFKLLGVKKKSNGEYDFSQAKELVVFCNGVWCGQSVVFIEDMIKHGYPKEKLFYYRGGMQAWKLLGLTTVVHKAIEAKESKK